MQTVAQLLVHVAFCMWCVGWSHLWLINNMNSRCLWGVLRLFQMLLLFTYLIFFYFLSVKYKKFNCLMFLNTIITQPQSWLLTALICFYCICCTCTMNSVFMHVFWLEFYFSPLNLSDKFVTLDTIIMKISSFYSHCGPSSGTKT